MSDAIKAAQDALRRKQMGRLPSEGDRNLIYDACNEAIAANASLTTRNAELAAECSDLRTKLAAAKDRDFEWWQALCLVDNVAPTPEAVKQWLLDVNEYHEKELWDQLAAAQKTIAEMQAACRAALELPRLTDEIAAYVRGGCNGELHSACDRRKLIIAAITAALAATDSH